MSHRTSALFAYPAEALRPTVDYLLAPHAIWQLAKQSGLFEEVGSFQSLRALRRL